MFSTRSFRTCAAAADFALVLQVCESCGQGIHLVGEGAAETPFLPPLVMFCTGRVWAASAATYRRLAAACGAPRVNASPNKEKLLKQAKQGLSIL
jgi:hypothetical protein